MATKTVIGEEKDQSKKPIRAYIISFDAGDNIKPRGLYDWSRSEYRDILNVIQSEGFSKFHQDPDWIGHFDAPREFTPETENRYSIVVPAETQEDTSRMGRLVDKFLRERSIHPDSLRVNVEVLVEDWKKDWIFKNFPDYQAPQRN